MTPKVGWFLAKTCQPHCVTASWKLDVASIFWATQPYNLQASCVFSKSKEECQQAATIPINRRKPWINLSLIGKRWKAHQIFNQGLPGFGFDFHWFSSLVALLKPDLSTVPTGAQHNPFRMLLPEFLCWVSKPLVAGFASTRKRTFWSFTHLPWHSIRAELH